jgi:hypothetical protein
VLTLIVPAPYSTPIGGASLNEPAMTEYQTHTSRPGVIGPIGKCIYGADHPTDDLSKEHVLPLGLSGGVVLTKASCGDCRDITSAFERTCLQHNFGMIRAHQEMPTRRPAERPTQGKLSVYNDGAKDVQEVPLAEHPYHPSIFLDL